MWNNVKQDVGLQRERELYDFWKPMLDHGARALRFRDSFESAWEITDSILGHRFPERERGKRNIPPDSPPKQRRPKIKIGGLLSMVHSRTTSSSGG
jgi:hypothetical protein